jgi:hypothetical protein
MEKRKGHSTPRGPQKQTDSEKGKAAQKYGQLLWRSPGRDAADRVEQFWYQNRSLGKLLYSTVRLIFSIPLRFMRAFVRKDGPFRKAVDKTIVFYYENIFSVAKTVWRKLIALATPFPQAPAAGRAPASAAQKPPGGGKDPESILLTISWSFHEYYTGFLAGYKDPLKLGYPSLSGARFTCISLFLTLMKYNGAIIGRLIGAAFLLGEHTFKTITPAGLFLLCSVASVFFCRNFFLNTLPRRDPSFLLWRNIYVRWERGTFEHLAFTVGAMVFFLLSAGFFFYLAPSRYGFVSQDAVQGRREGVFRSTLRDVRGFFSKIDSKRRFVVLFLISAALILYSSELLDGALSGGTIFTFSIPRAVFLFELFSAMGDLVDGQSKGVSDIELLSPLVLVALAVFRGDILSSSFFGAIYVVTQLIPRDLQERKRDRDMDRTCSNLLRIGLALGLVFSVGFSPLVFMRPAVLAEALLYQVHSYIAYALQVSLVLLTSRSLAEIREALRL